ncbi:hypothetical protein BaRGS_00008267 [Batillaria attramentaria]|uniref:Uncharacterized protein n=1 Tax=Batillaria attramentaria TaxID=370345 RepID=A0ABD0LLI8_9CAEN
MCTVYWRVRKQFRNTATFPPSQALAQVHVYENKHPNNPFAHNDDSLTKLSQDVTECTEKSSLVAYTNTPRGARELGVAGSNTCSEQGWDLS